MATIVQPYNPWKEQLALTALGNVAGNILSDLWLSHRQNEQNRKANAFRGQLQQNLQNNAQPDISLTPKEAPQGYNSNPWANAMHQNYTPLTAFDIGTSTVGKSPSIQDIVQGADSLAASKRFSMLSPELVQGVKNSMIQQAETQRLKDLQNNFSDLFGNAKSPAEQMRALVLANLNGFGDKAMAPFGSFAAHMSPHKQAIETDTGNTKRIDAFDPLTGNITPGAAYNVTVSPNTAATVAGSQNVAKINAGSAENVARIHALGDEARAQATVQAQQLKIWQEQHKALSEEIANDTANLAGLNEQEAIAMQSIINQKEQRLAQLEMLMSGAYSGTGSSQATQGDFGDLSYWDETSNGMGKDIHGKPFDYSALINKYAEHYGVDPDLAVAVMNIESAGDPNALSNKGAIGLFQLMPRTAAGIKSSRGHIINPNNIEDNIEGGIIYLRQMLDEFGGNVELALRAYNAGPARVKSGGNPNPSYSQKVLRKYRNYRAKRPQKQQNTATQSSPPQPQTEAIATQTQQQPTTQSQPDREVMRDKDGTVIYQSELDEMIREGAKQGLGPNGVIHGLRRKGFEYIPEKRNVTSVAPALNWSPSYMGGIPQGQALTSAPLPDLQKIQSDSATPQVPVTALTEAQPVPPFPDSYSDKNRRNSPQNTAGNPHAGVSQGNFSDFFSVPWGSFDIHQPILGGQRQQPLPQQQAVSNDSRLSPLFSDKAVNAASDFLQGLNLTSGDETAITPKHINPDIIDYSFDPRYSAWQRSAWQNGAGYDAQQILNWINSFQHNENPYWGHSQSTQSPQKLPIRGHPVNSGANPWSYVRENNPDSYSPLFSFADWLDNGSLPQNDVIPISVLYSDPFYYLKNFILGNRR